MAHFFLAAAASWRTCICTIMWLTFRARSVCFLMLKWIRIFFSISFWFSLLIQFSEKQMQNSEVKMGENNPILHLGVNEHRNADSSHSLPAPLWAGHGTQGEMAKQSRSASGRVRFLSFLVNIIVQREFFCLWCSRHCLSLGISNVDLEISYKLD